MKKLLLVSTAIAGLAMMSAPASAALKMDLGGYFDGYGVYAKNDPIAGVANSLKTYDLRRNSDIFVNGEATLDNGLTVGAHTDLDIGNNNETGSGNAGTNIVQFNQEYAYGSGGWGRVNFGVADGASYLLQVAAPSADSNIDGLRTNIQALNPRANTQDTRLAGILGDNATSVSLFGESTGADLGYAQDNFRQTDRLTYLTPKVSGFQGGLSYAPQPGITSATGTMNLSNPAVGPGTGVAIYKNIWEAGARWDGEFQGVAASLGAGYNGSSLQDSVVAPAAPANYNITDGVKTWNVGGNLAMSGFSLGALYKESKVNEESFGNTTSGPGNVVSGEVTDKTYDVGLGYDNGPYHVGGSYLHSRTNDPLLGATTTGNWNPGQRFTETRYTLGGGYTYGPGMTFRGSVAWGKFQNSAANGVGLDQAAGVGVNDSNDFTQVAIGTDIQF